MALQSYATPAQRIGKIKGEILAHAVPREVLSIGVNTKPMPKSSGDTIVWRRWLPYNATASSPNTFFTDGSGDRAAAIVNAHLAQEGVTPDAETLVPQDIQVTLNEYTVLFGYSKRTADLYEDDVPAEMKKQTGERIGLVRELIRYGAYKGCTNKFYGGTGTSRATVNGKLSLPLLRRVTKALDLQHAESVNEILSASTKYGTSAIESAFIVFIHTDLKPDVRDLPGFVPVAKYGTMSRISPYEVGACEEFRFIASPELVSVQDSATSVTAATYNLTSTTGTNPDVYQVIVVARGALGDVALRGAKSLDVHDLKPGQADKNDPTGQRGYIGASTYYACQLLNNMHCAVLEVGASVLS